MFSRVLNKRGNNDHSKEESSLKDGRFSEESTSRNNDCCKTKNSPRNNKKLTPLTHASPKNEDSGVIHQAESRTTENVNGPHIKRSQTIKPTLIPLNEAVKLHSVPKEKLHTKKSVNTAAVRKNADKAETGTPLCRVAEPLASVVKSKVCRSKSDERIGEKDTTEFSSLTDLRKVKKKCILVPSSLREKLLSVTPSKTLKFDNTNSAQNEEDVDYLKAFDSIIKDNNLFYPFSKSHSPSDAKEIFSLVPKISSPSKPIILKKRTYSFGLLSLNDPAALSSETEGNDALNVSNESKVESEDEEDELYFSGEDSDGSNYLRDSIAVGDNNHQSKKGKVPKLFINKPIRMEYTDEATNHTNELIIYSDEFLTKIVKEKGSMASQQEIFECLLQQCADYKGKSLRIILDIKNFFSELPGAGKSQGDIKWNPSGKVTKRVSQKASRNVTQKMKNVCSTPCFSKNRGSTTNKDSLKVGDKSYMRKFNRQKDIGDQAYVVKSDAKKRSSTRSHSQAETKTNEHSGDKHLKRGEENYDPENGRRSRTAKKRINVEEIISSDFKDYFHFYAKFRSRLRAGAAISKSNSNFWMKTCGIISDDSSEKIADECFDDIAKKKCVLNIIDYIQYLIKFARKTRVLMVDVIQQLMSIDTHSLTKLNRELEKKSFIGINIESIKGQEKQLR